MKKWLASFIMAAFVLLSACQQAPSETISSATLPPNSVEQSEGNSSRIKLEIPVKTIEDPEVPFILKIDAPVYYDGYTSAPSYICLPAKFDNTDSAAKLFFGDQYDEIQRTEDHDTTGISWPYETPLLWMEKYSSLEPYYYSLEFIHSLGTIRGHGDSGLGGASISNPEDLWKTGDKDGDGRASDMKRSREECLAQAQAFIDSLGLDMLLVRTDVLDLTELQLYRFYFGHNYDGIPSSIGVNDTMRQYSWGLSEGEFMTIYVCDAGIYQIEAMLYDVIETKEAQPIISAQEAVTKLIEAAQVYPFPISAYLADGHVIDSISLVYLPQAVEGDGVDVIGDGRGGGLMRNMIPAWQFSTGYSYGQWSAMEMYIDARTGEYLQ